MKHACRRCTTAFRSENILNHLIEKGEIQKPSALRIPKFNCLQFRDYQLKFPKPFSVFADCDCIIIPHQDETNNTDQTKLSSNKNLLR